MMRHFFNRVKEYFSFTSGEQKGALVLIIVIALVLVIPWAYRLTFPFKTYDYSPLKNQLTEVDTDTLNEGSGESDLFDKKTRLCLFDPNTITEQQMNELKFPETAIKSIVNYRKKKGMFLKKEDLKKMYGMTPEFFSGIEAFIHLENEPKIVSDKHPKNRVETTKEIISINSADSSDLVALKGIGPGYARKIIRYREKLGGFYSLLQIKEVYGLPDSVTRSLIAQSEIDQLKIKKLKINALSNKELALHPYISVYQAKGIVSYRELQGHFNNETELRKSKIFPDSLITRIMPYIEF